MGWEPRKQTQYWGKREMDIVSCPCEYSLLIILLSDRDGKEYICQTDGLIYVCV